MPRIVKKRREKKRGFIQPDCCIARSKTTTTTMNHYIEGMGAAALWLLVFPEKVALIPFKKTPSTHMPQTDTATVTQTHACMHKHTHTHTLYAITYLLTAGVVGALQMT